MTVNLIPDTKVLINPVCRICGENECIGECIDFLESAMQDYDPNDDFDDSRAIEDEQYRNY